MFNLPNVGPARHCPCVFRRNALPKRSFSRLNKGRGDVHGILTGVRANCVTSGAKTDTRERFVEPNVIAGQAKPRLFRKGGDA